MRAYYVAVLTLYAFDNGCGAQHDERALAMYRALLSECRHKLDFGASHEVVLALRMYFAMHWLRVDKFELAVECIEHVQRHLCADARTPTFAELRMFHDVLDSWTVKLLALDDKHRVFDSDESNGQRSLEHRLPLFEMSNAT